MSSRFVTSALMTSALFAMAVAASPALACKGSTTLLRDDFTDEDPAWNIQDSNVQIANGALKLKSEPGKIYNLMYQGQDFPGADACVEMITPAVKDPAGVFGGLSFWGGGKWNIVYVAPDGTAGVTAFNNSGWTNPVPNRKFDGVKTGANAVNTIRVTWKAPPAQGAKDPADPNVTVFINDKQFIKFKVQPNGDRSVGLYVQSEGATYQFKNLNITY
jgi:hypothetical protein